MDAGKKQLADILNGNRVLEVPYYQRSYVWKEEQWARFISDMSTSRAQTRIISSARLSSSSSRPASPLSTSKASLTASSVSPHSLFSSRLFA